MKKKCDIQDFIACLGKLASRLPFHPDFKLPCFTCRRRFCLLFFALFLSVFVLIGSSPIGAAEIVDKASVEKSSMPEVVRATIAEGNAALQSGNYDLAKAAYETARKVVPNDLLVLTNLGFAEFYLGNQSAAEALLKKAVQQHIETAPAWMVLGLIYLDQKRLEEALAALTQANLYDPNNARVRNYLGVVTGELGWYDAAESQLRKALEIDPNYPDAHFNLAHFYLIRKSPAFELARRHYYRALELGSARDEQMEELLKGGK